MGWTGIAYEDKGDEHLQAEVLRLGVSGMEVVDSVLLRDPDEDGFDDLVFAATRIGGGEVVGWVLLFEIKDGKLWVKPIDESMGPIHTPFGSDAKRVVSKLTDSEYADPRWRAAIMDS
jgi:hypothetical protein